MNFIREIRLKSILFPLLTHLLLLCVSLAAIYGFSVENVVSLEGLSAARIVEVYLLAPRALFVTSALIPAVAAGLICNVHGGSLLQASALSLYCGLIAGLLMAGSGFAIPVGVSATSMTALGYFAHRQDASNKKRHADASGADA